MTGKISMATKFVVSVSVLLLIAVLFLPMWRIELSAPQYPEGLVLQIYPHKLGGDIDVVNGLNHYIGMRTLHTRDFIEFAVLPYIIGILAFFGLLTLLINRRWFFLMWAGFFFLFAIVAMIDFYRWEYNYGHNLDPAAPIQVPGMSYQPPLIGFKQLLNFGAYSIPDAGGWLFILAGVLLAVATIRELLTWKRTAGKLKTAAVAASLLVLNACQTGPQPVQFNHDACYACKMTITDNRFGAELVTRKGKVYKFDDAHCLRLFLRSGAVDNKDIADVYFVGYTGNGKLINAQDAVLLRSGELRAPMGGDLAAFDNKDSAVQLQHSLNGTITAWHEINP